MLLLAAGALLRLGLAVLLVHRSYDMDSVRIVNATLRTHPQLVYQTGRWPYPGAMLPWTYLAGTMHRLTGLDISIFFKLPSIAADLAIGWCVQDFLRLRGASDSERLVALALVCLGPSFAAISGYDGQIDAIAILPAVASLLVWERQHQPGASGRLSTVALLIGIGGAIKTIPLLMLFVFLPRLPSWRERLRFASIVLILPLVSVLPWLVTKPHSLSIVLNYTGLGVGPLTLALQPDLAKTIVSATTTVRPDAISTALGHHGKVLLVAALAVSVLLLARRQPRIERAAVLVWLAVYAFMPFFFLQYVVWGLPFLLMARYLRAVCVAQVLLLAPLIIFDGRPWATSGLWVPYAGLLSAVWLWAAVTWVWQSSQLWRRGVATGHVRWLER